MTDAVAPAEGGSAHTLRRQLVLRVAAVVTLLALVLGLFATTLVRQLLTDRLDDSLLNLSARQNAAPDRGRRGEGYDSDDHTPIAPGIDNYGNPLGTILLQRTASGDIRVSQITDAEIDPVTNPEVIGTLVSLTPDGYPRTVSLKGLGDYRVVADQLPSGNYLAAALPMDSVDRVTGQMILWQAGLSLLAVVGSILISRAAISASLKPLNRLANTATEVSQLRLDRGEVALPMRIHDRDADPRNEVGQVGDAFNHMLNNVEEALAARQRSEMKVRQFVADASHELRNPLASIRGYAELTRHDRDLLTSDTAFAMERIEFESERMSRLVEDLLLLARLDNDPDLELTPVDVVEVVLNSVNDAQVAGPNHHWKLELPDEQLLGMADPYRLHQVVVNLLANARTHTPPGTTVTTSVTTDQDRVSIRVHDDGPGIDPAVQDEVFERFVRAESSRTRSSKGSTGLGLAIVAAVMKAHHGGCAVQSQPGDTTFTLWVPRGHDSRS